MYVGRFGKERWTRCGTASCRCSQGQLHGPYYDRHWSENGKRRKAYIPRDEVDEVRAQCEARRQHERQVVDAQKELQKLRACLRDLDDR